MNEKDLLYQIRGAIYDTYYSLGAGLLEKVYQEVLVHFLIKRGLNVRQQVHIPITVDGVTLDTDLIIDILVEDKIIIELKSVLEMKNVFHCQILTYLRLTKLHRGVLVNFNTENIDSTIWYKVNGFIDE